MAGEVIVVDGGAGIFFFGVDGGVVEGAEVEAKLEVKLSATLELGHLTEEDKEAVVNTLS